VNAELSITLEYSVEQLNALKPWQTFSCYYSATSVHFLYIIVHYTMVSSYMGRHLPSEGIHSKSQAFSFSKTITNKYLISSISIYTRHPHPHPPTSTPLHSTSKVERLTQPIIGQCMHIYPTDRNNEQLE